MNTKIIYLLFAMLICFGCSSESAETESIKQDTVTYFPPLGSDTWETLSAESLGWNTSALQPLLDFLEQKNTKSFIILYDGKIVVEAYMNDHTATKPWYWASAGKTLTTAVSGIAEDEGFINIENKVSHYLGNGWTAAPLDKENLITCKHLLSMTAGLDDTLGDSVSKENLQYVADAGTRWAYHNVYVKMQQVVATASNMSWNAYFNSRLKNKIGMNGSWIPLGDLNVYWSNARSMARFGLMSYAKGKWENTQIVSEGYLNDATSTSQNINKSYGYLWWLNGKDSYRLPQSQTEFNGELIPNAPDDMYSGLGKNDQKLYIVPSKKLVIVRMGDSADDVNFALSTFDNDLWEKINALID